MDTKLEAVRTDQELATDKELKVAVAAAWEHVLAIALLMGSDCMWYSKLLEDLENDFTHG